MKRVCGAGLVAALAAGVFVGCEYPNDPLPSLGGGGAVISEDGEIVPINSPYQVCNPSVSQDVVNYRDCMLWLNFNGSLSMKVPQEWAATYTVSDVAQHDRLTVTDFNDSLRWFFMRDSLPEVRGHLQDPEWTTHPAYIAFLGSTSASNSAGTWSGYVVRTTDKKVLKFSALGLTGESTPHVWIGGPSDSTADTASVRPHGFVPRDSIRAYFGTDSVKIAYSLYRNGLTLFYVDYCDGKVDTVQLAKPSDKLDYNAESAMISPDGNWVVYHLWKSDRDAASYVQRLAPGSAPILLANPGFDPHWWFYNGSAYVLYSTTGVVTSEVLDEKVADGSAGRTMRQQVKLAPLGPKHIMFSKVGEPESLLPYPFKGGLSPDGFYAATGYKYAYMYRFN